jgi:hypothetical protein
LVYSGQWAREILLNSGSTLDLYSGDTVFESWQGYRYSKTDAHGFRSKHESSLPLHGYAFVLCKTTIKTCFWGKITVGPLKLLALNIEQNTSSLH